MTLVDTAVVLCVEVALLEEVVRFELVLELVEEARTDDFDELDCSLEVVGFVDEPDFLVEVLVFLEELKVVAFLDELVEVAFLVELVEVTFLVELVVFLLEEEVVLDDETTTFFTVVTFFCVVEVFLAAATEEDEADA